jgi:hypothetical protein
VDDLPFSEAYTPVLFFEEGRGEVKRYWMKQEKPVACKSEESFSLRESSTFLCSVQVPEIVNVLNWALTEMLEKFEFHQFKKEKC